MRLDPPLDPTSAQAREWLEAELRKGVYQDDPGLLQRLWDWVARTFAGARLHREWPVAERRPDGAVVGGTADLVLRARGGLVLIDHKTFPGTLAAAVERLPRYSGQLATYARAIRASAGK